MVTSTIFGVPAAVWSGSHVVTSRLNTGYWYTKSFVLLFRFLNRFTSRVFANSEEAKRIAVATEKVPPEKVDVIYNGVDVNRYSPGKGHSNDASTLGVPADARVVGMVANLRPVKDIPLFLRAAAIVANRIRGVAFLVVGEGDLRADLGRLAVELGINDKVFFSEGRGVVEDYLRRMSIGCLTSQSEGFSNAILEYMASGLPVVASNVGGNSEAIADGETGYIVRERTPEAFAEPIIHLLDSEELRAAMGRRARERSCRLFSMDVYCEHMRQYYRSFAF
jgi:glycosyltransferase involved in cell wall biosynthesis